MNYLNFSQEVKRIIAQVLPVTPIKCSQFRICAQLNENIRHSLPKFTFALHMQQQLPHNLQVLHLDLAQSKVKPMAVGLCSTHTSSTNTQHGNTETCTTYSIQEVIGIRSSTEILESQHSNKFYCSIYVSVKTKHNILFSNTKLISAIQPYTLWRVSLSLCTKNTIPRSCDAEILRRDATDKKKKCVQPAFYILSSTFCWIVECFCSISLFSFAASTANWSSCKEKQKIGSLNYHKKFGSVDFTMLTNKKKKRTHV